MLITVNVLKFRTFFSFCSQKNVGFQGWSFTKCLPDYHTGSVRNKEFSCCPSQVGFAGGKLKVSDGCPLDNLKFQKIILFI